MMGSSVRFALVPLLLCSSLLAQHDGEARKIVNPYFETTQWKVWRDHPEPVPDVLSLVRDGKIKKQTEITLEAPPVDQRLFPVTRPGRFLAYEKVKSSKFAGIWDDVYASWSGLHGYVRNRWKGPGDNVVGGLLGQIIHFVDVGRRNTLRAGVNFIHQSTTGMGHTLTNGYGRGRLSLQHEKLYFADVLVTAPAHLSFTDLDPQHSSDLYLALFPTIFNSVGSSNSETMAITKMILAGGYLPPATKLALKRNGLYPAAMLYMWKAALPYDVPYDNELRHRIAYKSIGDRSTYPERYTSAGIDKGDLALAYHRYDDAAHMRAMIEIAKSMTVPLPEAVFDVESVEGGRKIYGLKKAALVLQEPGQTVTVKLSTKGCYDIGGRPVTSRWKLLYGNRRTRLVRDGDHTTITVPWDDALPEGRTCIALIANNGVFDSNPAVVSVYRKRQGIPPNGGGYGDYKYPSTFTNRRPVILDLQDQVLRKNRTAKIEILAVDPEGQPLRFYKRTGEVGELDGNVLTWRPHSKDGDGPRPVTIICSDGTGGNSYGGKQIELYVGKPKVYAHITAKQLVGKAPFTVEVSAAGSFGAKGRLQYGWEFFTPVRKHKSPTFSMLPHGKTAKHTFDKPGVYVVKLSVESGTGKDTETVRVLVTKAEKKPEKAAVLVTGNGVEIADGDTTPQAFDHTLFVGDGSRLVRDFTIHNRGDEELELLGSHSVHVDSKAFRVVQQPRRKIAARGSTRMTIEWRKHAAAPDRATVEIRAKVGSFKFGVGR